jgi:hypothetical protein
MANGIRRLRGILLGAAAVGLIPGSSQADGLLPGGTIIGVFSNVDAAGFYLNYPTLGQDEYVNNTGTAVYSITNSTDTTVSGPTPVQTTGSSLKWGTYPPGYGVSADESFSELNFFGGVIPSDIHEPFQLGTITFLNGTSILSSQIFSAELSFYDNSVSYANYLGTDTVYISTTNNFYASTAQDADWINICGNGSNICDTRVEAVETYEGGTGVTANLDGYIVGDPTLNISSVSLAPDQTATGNGFIASGPQMATSIPEPSTWAMMLLGLAGLGYPGWRRQRRAGAVAA